MGCEHGDSLVETERIVLATILVADRMALPRLLADPVGLRPWHFSDERHRLVFAAILELHEATLAVDVITVCDALQDSGQLERGGGRAYINSLFDALPKLDLARMARRIIDAAGT